MAVYDEPRGDFLVHAGLVPDWTPRMAAKLAREVEAVLRDDARTLFDSMYGNKPDRWSDSLRGMDRLRFVINAFTRMRYCRADGSIDLKAKGMPGEQPEDLIPWFDAPERKSAGVRVICGHWSTLGYRRRPDLLAIDTGCIWGGALTAVNLETDEPPVQLGCRSHQVPGEG
jgi:bis(5'-nucleosyl)-tetraphosphatase (symmetrical)